jgi:hypothetical protein
MRPEQISGRFQSGERTGAAWAKGFAVIERELTAEVPGIMRDCGELFVRSAVIAY